MNELNSNDIVMCTTIWVHIHVCKCYMLKLLQNALYIDLHVGSKINKFSCICGV